MASVLDVAKYFLETLGPMSTWKLQKLCYYAQAWSLVWDEKPLFPENFEAWSNGPVCPQLFHEHKGLFMISSGDLRKGDSSVFDEEQKETLDVVSKDYGDKNPSWLRDLTHFEDPWKNARGNTPLGARSSAVITNNAMGEYYGSL